MATASYLPDVAGGMVAGATFASDDAAAKAVASLRAAGVRLQDISVIAGDPARAARIASDQAWTPGKGRSRGPLGMLRAIGRGGPPVEIKQRYGPALRDGAVLVVAAADGQPSDTLAELLAQSGAAHVEQWWQQPADIFAPPELAGPF